MQEHIQATLFSPFRFFSGFEEKRIGWLPSLVGYYACGLGVVLGYFALVFRPAFGAEFAFLFILDSLIGGAAAILAVGFVWMWGISRLAGGRASLSSSLKATGVALIWPGIATTLVCIIVIICLALGKIVPWILVIILQMGVAIWLLLMLCACTRGLNHFGLSKVFIVIFSPLLLWMALALFTNG